ncbi:MAG: 4'-phosphopantetheinyl transferase superfamily protein, partial [Clostridia bacterium]|nr:4'-phosphopantetheinyl transferase superfamily protein [Clostridia bacterium]
MVGIDIIEVERVDTSDAFLNRIAHESEISYINKSSCNGLRHQRIAALFCVKEAVMKALEMGAKSGVVFKDI